MPVVSPTSTDGRIAMHDQQHYYGAIPSLNAAKIIANAFDIVIANNYGTFEDEMYAITTSVRPNPPIMGYYGKSVQIPNSEEPLPENFHAHNPAGQHINIFSTSIWLAQADHPSPTPYTDPRGFTVSTFRDYRANEKWATIQSANNKTAGADPFCLAYLDSMSAYVSAGSNVGNPGPPVDWQHGGTYGSSEFNTISYSIGDATKSLRPAPGYWVFGNGLRSGSSYMGSGTYPNPNGGTSDLPPHIDGGVAESWFRDNGQTFAQMKNRGESGWQKDIDMMVHCQVIQNISCLVIANVFNRAANPTLVNPNLTAAQLDQEIRFSCGIFMLGNRGKAYYHYTKSTNGTADPEMWTHPYFGLALGPATDNLAPAIAYKQSSGVYERNYTNGKWLVNMSAGTINHVVGAGWKDINGNAVGTTVAVPAYDAIPLLGTNVNPPPPPGGGYTNVLTDHYSRVVAPGGLGTADTGQTYALSGTASQYQVDGTKAIVNTPVNAGRRALPTNINILNCRSYGEAAFAELSVGDSQVFYIWVRQNSAGDTGYRLRCELTTGNILQYRTQKVVGSVATSIGTLKTMPGTYAPGTRFKCQVQAYGVNPTTLSYKLWPSSASEPGSWDGEDSDSQAELQIANNAAWSLFIQALNTNAPADIYIYDFLADEYVPAPPPPSNASPILDVIGPNNGDEFDADVNATAKFTLSASATDPDAGDFITKITYSLNGGTEVNLSLDAASQVWSRLLVLPAGSYDILVTAYDNSGNTTAQTNNVTVNPYVPAAPPVVDSGGSVGAVIASPIEEFVIVLSAIDGHAIGEILGSDMRFGRYVKGSGFMSFESHRNHPLVKPGLMIPDAVDYSVQRNGVELAAGTITDCDRDTDDEMVRVAGRDWKAYFEQLVLPFDPSQSLNSQDYHSGSSNDSTTDATNIVEGLVAKVLAGYTNTIQVTMHNDPTGLVLAKHFLASDLASLRDMIQSVADEFPGFDWEITPDQRLVIHAPQKGIQSTLVLDESNIKTVHFSPQGIQGNILYGRGSGTGSSQMLYKITNPNSRALYRDRVVVTDFGEMRSKSAVKQATRQNLAEVSTQVVEFWVTMYPQGEDVWSQAEDGDSIYVHWNDGDIILDDYYRCNGFETFVNAQGDTEVTWHFDLNMDQSSDG